MQFDQLSVSLLILRDDAPPLTTEEEDALQDRHMAHLADLHEQGLLVAAGPLLGPPDRLYRGVSVFRVGVDEARRLAEENPSVVEGRHRVEVFTWLVPAGAMQFAPARFPRSAAEAQS